MRKLTHQRWQNKQKDRALRILKELTKRIEKGQLIIDNAGFWPSKSSNEIIFRFVTISRDSQKDSTEIGQLL